MNPVTGVCGWRAFFWVQSMVRDDGQRTLLFDLDMAINQVNQALPNHRAVVEPDQLLSQLAASLRGGVDRYESTLCRILCQALLSSHSVGLGYATASVDPEPVSRIAVVFVEAGEIYRRKTRRFEAELSTAILDAHRKVHAGNRETRLPPDMHLDIRITDIDLAGDFEPWRGRNPIRCASSKHFIRRGSSSSFVSSTRAAR